MPDGVVHRRWATRLGDNKELRARAARVRHAAHLFRLDEQYKYTALDVLAASQGRGGVKRTLSKHY